MAIANSEKALLSCISQDAAVIGSEVMAVFQRDNPFVGDIIKRIYHAYVCQPDKGVWNTSAIIDKLGTSIYKADWFNEVRAVMNAEPHTVHWRQHLEAVREAYIKRTAKLVLEQAAVDVEHAEKANEFLSTLSKKLVTIDVSAEEDQIDMRDEVLADIAILKNKGYMNTGIDAVDEVIGPMYPGEVLTIAARTSVGKSLLATNIVRHLSLTQKIPGVYFSFEMPPAKHIARIVASMLHLNSKQVAMMYDEGKQEVVDMYERVFNCPIIWDKRPRLNTAQICNKVRRLSATKGIKYSIVDHLGFVKLAGRAKKQDEVGDFIKEYKSVCAECGVIPIMLVQINRTAVESEHGIGLHHLKDSGSIEEDSSQVLLLDRETTLTAEERQRVVDGKSLPLKCAGAKSRYDMTGFKQLALFLHSSLIQSKAIDDIP